MNPQLRQMIGEEAYIMLQKADDKKLEEMRYVVLDETCKTTFYETSGKGAKILFSNVKGDTFIPFHWYINAARHFVENQFHSIRVFLISGSDRTLVKDLSSDWKAQFAAQKQTLKPKLRTTEGFKKAMLAELSFLERQADKAYGKLSKKA